MTSKIPNAVIGAVSSVLAAYYYRHSVGVLQTASEPQNADAR